jgi:hypothetical protein
MNFIISTERMSEDGGGLVIGPWSFVICHLSLGEMGGDWGDWGDWGSSTSRLQSFCFVRSNDFSRYRVTWPMPSNAHVRPCLQSPTRQAIDPEIAGVMAIAITPEQRLKSLLQTRRNNFNRDTEYLPHQPMTNDQGPMTNHSAFSHSGVKLRKLYCSAPGWHWMQVLRVRDSGSSTLGWRALK